MTGAAAGRSWRAWVFALATMLTLSFAARDALAFAFQDSAPEFVLRIDPGNPIASVRLAQARATAGDAALTPDRLAETARGSIARLPLNVGAFRLIATTARGRTTLEELGERMAVAHHLSRRDVGTELFMIEDAVRRNDAAGALEYYDTALRVGQSSRTLLYPVLTEALNEPLVRQRFVPFLNSPPPWLESFLRFAVSNSTNPSSMVELSVLAGGFPGGKAYESIDTELLTALVERKQLATAVRYYLSLPNAKPALATSVAMSQEGINPAFAPISWQAYSIPGIDAVWIAAGQGLELEALLDAGFVGPVARKVLALRPGTYRLAAPFRTEGYDPSDSLTWTIACPDDRKLMTTTVSLAPQGRLEPIFMVPDNCPAQMVMVAASTAPGSATITLTLQSPTVNPAQ